MTIPAEETASAPVAAGSDDREPESYHVPPVDDNTTQIPDDQDQESHYALPVDDDTTQMPDDQDQESHHVPPVDDNTTQMPDTATPEKENTTSAVAGTTSKENRKPRVETHEDVEFPDAFHCPLSHHIFQDPVVAKDGETYEKSAYLEQRANDDLVENKLYPNRALKAIIDDARLRQSGSIQANLKRLHYTAERAMTEFLEPSSSSPSTSHDAYFPLSEGFHCPITFNIMFDPVIDPEGNTYERVAAENWIRVNGNSPVTRSKLTVDELYPNHVIRRLLDEEKGKSDDKMHPDIQRWKDEPAPKATDVEHGGGIIVAAAAAGNSGTGDYGIPGASYPSPFPTTQTQRYQRQMTRRATVFNLAGIFLCILSVVGLVLLGRTFFLLMFMMTLVIIFSKRQIR